MYSTMSSEQEMLRDSVRRFMKSEVAPTVAQHDKDKTFPFELLKELSLFGYIGGRQPEALGGMDMDQMTWALLMEEAGYPRLQLRTLWISNGAFGDFGIVVARTFSPDCQGGLSTFLVERDVSPYEVRNVDTMVLRSTGTAELAFDNVKVPRENLLGEEGNALKKMLMGLDGARVNIAMGAVGAAQAALDLSIDYARTRTQFGKPIGSFQLVQKLILRT